MVVKPPSGMGQTQSDVDAWGTADLHRLDDSEKPSVPDHSLPHTAQGSTASPPDSANKHNPPHMPPVIRRHEQILRETIGKHGLPEDSLTGRSRRESESTTSTVPTSNSTLPASTTDSSIPTITVTEYSDPDTDIDVGAYAARIQQQNKQTSQQRSSVARTTEMDIDLNLIDRGGHRSTHHRSSEQSSASKKHEKKRTSVTRKASDSSTSVMSESSVHSGLGATGKNKLAIKKKVMLGQGDRKGSLADKWGNMVDEYENTFVGHSPKNLKKQKTQKVRKLSNMERYDKVKQVFNKEMVLPIHKQGHRVGSDELESESGASEMSVHSWTAFTPLSRQDEEMRRRSSQMNQLSSVSQVVRQNRHSNTGSSASSGHEQSHAAKGRLKNRAIKTSSSDDSKVKSKKRVSKKGNVTIEEKASEIVETVIGNALTFLYGSDHKSGNKSGHKGRRSSSNSKKYSSTSDLDAMDGQSSYYDNRKSSSAHLSKSVENITNVKKIQNSYVEHRKKAPKAVRSGQGRQRRQSYIRVIPGSGKRRDSRMSNENLSNVKLEKSKSVPYSSDSEYSTSLEIKREKEFNSSNAGIQNKSHKVNPPTITRGTVTRVLHELNETLYVPPASNIIAGLLPDSQPGIIESEYEYSTNTWPLEKSTYSETTVLNDNNDSYATLPLRTSSEQSSESQYFSEGMCVGRPVSFVVDASTLVDGNQKLAVRRDKYEVSSETSSLPPIAEVDENQSAVYSNEPIIVAGLMDKEQQQNGSYVDTASGRSSENEPAVKMFKNQQLNFYLFNQAGTPPTAINKEYKGTITNYATQVNGAQARPPSDNNDDTSVSSLSEETELRHVLIHHKQTQTAGEAQPVPPPRKNRNTRSIESKQFVQAHNAAPQQVYAPAPPPPKSTHRETTHYVTHHTEVEKIPQDKPTTEISVQTEDVLYKPKEMSQNEYRMRQDSLPTWPAIIKPIPKLTIPPPQENFPLSPEVKMYTREIDESQYPKVVYSQTRQLQESRNVRSPSPQIIKPVQMTNDNNDILNLEEVKKIIPVNDKSDSEEEIIETIIIEEKEQRIAMTVYEEIEFQMQRSQGGKTVTGKEGHSNIEPFWIPPKYEAIVDRRKQKSTQIKDVEKEGDQSLWGAPGNQAALEYPITDNLENSLIKNMNSVNIVKDGKEQLYSEHPETAKHFQTIKGTEYESTTRENPYLDTSLERNQTKLRKNMHHQNATVYDSFDKNDEYNRQFNERFTDRNNPETLTNKDVITMPIERVHSMDSNGLTNSGSLERQYYRKGDDKESINMPTHGGNTYDSDQTLSSEYRGENERGVEYSRNEYVGIPIERQNHGQIITQLDNYHNDRTITGEKRETALITNYDNIPKGQTRVEEQISIPIEGFNHNDIYNGNPSMHHEQLVDMRQERSVQRSDGGPPTHSVTHQQYINMPVERPRGQAQVELDISIPSEGSNYVRYNAGNTGKPSKHHEEQSVEMRRERSVQGSGGGPSTHSVTHQQYINMPIEKPSENETNYKTIRSFYYDPLRNPSIMYAGSDNEVNAINSQSSFLGRNTGSDNTFGSTGQGSNRFDRLSDGDNTARSYYELRKQKMKSEGQDHSDGVQNLHSTADDPPSLKLPLRLSQYDPENVSFGRKSGRELLKEVDETAFDLNEILKSAESVREEKQTSGYQQQTQKNTGSLDRTNQLMEINSSNEHNHQNTRDDQIVKETSNAPQSADSPAMMKTRYVKDKDGNMMKITEMQQTSTTTKEYVTDHGDTGAIALPMNSSIMESGGAASQYMQMSSSRQVIADGSANSDDEDRADQENIIPVYSGPEVVAETTLGLKPYHYEHQERSVKVSEDNDNIPALHQYLYDMKTAELQAVHCKDDDYDLVQYAVGETMVTEL